jgi:PAS domain S-box-containing protein
LRPAPGAILHTVHGKLAGAILAGMLIARTCAFALNPALDVSQYAHTAWKIRDGFAKGSIIAIAQTPDGYLWLGTAFGLYRFDGVRNVVWQPPPDQQLPSNTITKLVVARDGTLWIGTWSGLVSWKNGQLTQYAELAGLHIFALVEGDEGSIWAGTSGPPDGKLCEIRDGSVRCGPEMGGVDRGVFGLHKDSKGNLWVGLETGVWRWRPGPPEFYAVPGLPNGRMQGMADSEDGTVLIAATGAVMRLADGKAKAVYQFPTARRGFRVLKMLRDRDGGLWVCPAGRGIAHIHQGRTDVFSESDGLSGDDIYDLFEDREGNIWVATINGLDRFHELPVVTYSRKQGLSDIPWGGMLAARDGSIWFATLDGLNRLNHGEVTVYRQHRTTASKQKAVGNGLPDEGVGSLFQDSRGRIWVSTPRGVGYLETNRFVPTAVPGGLVGSITGDASGNLWIANRELGLLRLSQDRVFPPIPWATFGRKDPAVFLATDPLHGGLWLGFSRGGVVWFRDGQVRSSYSATDGLGKGAVSQLRFDSEGALWIATEGGITRLKDGHIATLTSKSGLPCDAVQWTMEDDAQSVWLMMPCGLVQVARSELDTRASARDKTPGKIRTTVFDNSDGLRTLAVVGDYTPRVAKSGDGKLWFMSPDGIGVVDPHQLPFNRLPPPVHIEKVVADRKEYGKTLSGDVQSSPRLHSPVRELEIDYSALSLVVPEKVLFRYKLEGWDQDWQDAGTRRQAFYSNLPPRNYTFRVKACNNSGLWNEAGTSFNFSIAPAYYQTYWFRFACFATFVALLWALHRWRIRQLKGQEKRLRDVVETIPAMTFTALSDGSSTFVNKRWTEYTGLSVEQSSGAGWQRAIHPEDLVRHSGKWRISVATGQLFEDEARFRCAADRGYRWFLVRGVPLRDQHGTIVRWYGTLTDLEDRKRAEEALQQSQLYLAEGQRLAHMGSWAFNATGFEYWSSELFRIHGLDPSGKPPTVEEYLALVQLEDRAFMKQGITNMLVDHRAFDFTKRIVRPGGEIRHVRCVGVPVTKGEIFQGFLGTGMDVTEQERLTGELRLSEQYLSEGQRLAQMGSWAFSPSGSFEYWSQELFKIYGLDPRKGAPTLEQYLATVHPQDRDFMADTIKRMHAERSGCDVKKRIVRPDGELRYIRCVGIPVVEGEVLKGFLGTAIDITEQELLNQELERRQAYLTEAQKLSHTGSWAWSPATDNRYYSEECYRVLGFEPHGPPPPLETVIQRIHLDDQAYCREQIERAIREKVDCEFDYRIVHPDKRVRDIHCVGHPVLDRSGDLVELLGTVIDITERKSAEQERDKLRQLEADLAHTNRVSTLGEMAASLAHEIKQPIAAAITSANSCLEWLGHDPPNLDRARAAAARIDKYGNRAAEIIDRIRSFYKKSPPQRELVDANGIIQEMLTLLKGEADRYSITMHTGLSAELPNITVDRVQLQQVFMNLMLNAIEAMKESGGELTVKSQLQDGQFQFSVSDTGVGLPMEKMDQIFSAFFTTKPQGSGMGLAISRSIVESHGGRLWATANHGRGATFHFTLPTEAP